MMNSRFAIAGSSSSTTRFFSQGRVPLSSRTYSNQ